MYFGNMSQQSGTSLMLTQSAGQQVAADLSCSSTGHFGLFSKSEDTESYLKGRASTVPCFHKNINRINNENYLKTFWHLL
jgi:hypothetical protein